MLADVIDAVVGVDTHRDTHEVELASPGGTPIATCRISKDSAGFAELLAWIIDRAPGPGVTVSIEGTRSYGIGLTPRGRGRRNAGDRVRTAPAHDASRERASPTPSMRTWPC